MIASAEYARRNNLDPIGRLVSLGIAGVEPRHWGSARAGRPPGAEEGRDGAGPDGPGGGERACRQPVRRVEKELGLDRERTNVSGGAIALSHPLGASGARITVHSCTSCGAGKRFGLGSACIGGGQGIAMVWRRSGAELLIHAARRPSW